jgi:hypothetical protein
MIDPRVRSLMDVIFDEVKSLDIDNCDKREFLDKVGIEKSLFNSYTGNVEISLSIPISFDYDMDETNVNDVIDDWFDSIVGDIPIDCDYIHGTDGGVAINGGIVWEVKR